MTQADIPTWGLTFQLKLMAALDAVWATLEGTDNPVLIRQARDKAKAIGDLAAMARRVALLNPAARAPARPRPDPMTEAVAAHLLATKGEADLSALIMDSRADHSEAAPPTQAEITRRALTKLKGGRRGRL